MDFSIFTFIERCNWKLFVKTIKLKLFGISWNCLVLGFRLIEKVQYTVRGTLQDILYFIAIPVRFFLEGVGN